VEGNTARLPAAQRAAVLLAASFGSGIVGILITHHAQATAAWWPAAGVGLLTLITAPRRWWPWLLVALAGTYLAANAVEGRPLDASAWLALADILETALVGIGIRRRIGRRLGTLADFGWFLALSLGGAVIAGVGVAATSVALLDGRFWPTVAAATCAHWASVMVLVPLGMAPLNPVRGRTWLIGVQAALLAIATAIAFGSASQVTLGFLPLPLLIWAGVSFGYRVVALEQVAVAVLVTTMTVLDRGPFHQHTQSDSQHAQLYLVSLVIAGLPLALAVGEQLRATAEARSARLRTEMIIESSPVSILVTDAEGTLLSMNPALTAMTGFEPGDLLGRPFWERLIPPDRWHNAQHQILDDGLADQGGSGAILTASGGERIVRYSNGFLLDPRDDTVNYVITATDITAERASSYFLEHLFRSATAIALIATDHIGTITLVNAGASSILRVTPEEATGRNLLEFLDPQEVEDRWGELGLAQAAGPPSAFAALVSEVDSGAVPQTRDWSWLPPDGVGLRVSMTASVVDDNRHRPMGYLFVARDVTETRRNQELLHQALEREQAAVGHLQALDSAKDDFVSTVSHELRTPLTSIIGSTEILSDGLVGALPPDQRRLVEVIERNAERLLALANDLLLLASFESNAAHPPFARVDLREVVQGSTTSIAPLLAQRDLALSSDLPAQTVLVQGDAGYLERAVTNLLTNAVKFTPDGGSITVTLRRETEAALAHLSVSDTGIGIPADELADVFGRFYRSRNVQADAIQGTGLGLSIVSSIVESHRGTIDVHSEPGAGTTFTVALPLV
jgi:PAS domain S-box-containing protein